SANSFSSRTSVKFARNPFRIRTSRTKDLKSFRIRTYEKRGEGRPRDRFVSCCRTFCRGVRLRGGTSALPASGPTRGWSRVGRGGRAGCGRIPDRRPSGFLRPGERRQFCAAPAWYRHDFITERLVCTEKPCSAIGRFWLRTQGIKLSDERRECGTMRWNGQLSVVTASEILPLSNFGGRTCFFPRTDCADSLGAAPQWRWWRCWPLG